ncbi:LOW QUALITY PROTEIN: glucokinase regulatory protein [Glossophaga mutica]
MSTPHTPLVDHLQVSFNQLIKGLVPRSLYTYLIVGGDGLAKLVASREGTEDSALNGTEELKKAPSVAGQMDYGVGTPAVFLPVLFGLHPVSMVSTLEATSVTKFLLSPPPQPKGLRGSSWVKGGSSPQILLETLLLTAHRTEDQGTAASQSCVLELLQTFEKAHQVTYHQSPKMGLVKQVSTSLEKKGVYLVGWHTLGITATTDGVEYVHTFGAGGVLVHTSFLMPPDPDLCPCFIIGDHSDMFNLKARLISQGPPFSLPLEDSLTSILPSLMEIDIVVLVFTVDGESGDRSGGQELSSKWVLSIVSTGAPVLLG